MKPAFQNPPHGRSDEHVGLAIFQSYLFTESAFFTKNHVEVTFLLPTSVRFLVHRRRLRTKGNSVHTCFAHPKHTASNYTTCVAARSSRGVFVVLILPSRDFRRQPPAFASRKVGAADENKNEGR